MSPKILSKNCEYCKKFFYTYEKDKVFCKDICQMKKIHCKDIQKAQKKCLSCSNISRFQFCCHLCRNLFIQSKKAIKTVEKSKDLFLKEKKDLKKQCRKNNLALKWGQTSELKISKKYESIRG